MSSGALSNMSFSVVNPPLAVGQPHSLTVVPARYPNIQLPNFAPSTHVQNLLVSAHISAGPSFSVVPSGNGPGQDSGRCIVCGSMQSNLVNHMASHSKEEMIAVLMNKSEVSPFSSTVTETHGLNGKPQPIAKIFPSPFSVPSQSSPSSVSVVSENTSSNNSCCPTLDNAAAAAAALLHLGGNLGNSSDRAHHTNRESKPQFSPWVNIASTSSVSAAGQSPPDYHQPHTQAVPQIATNSQACPNFTTSFLLATPRSHNLEVNKPSVVPSTNQCSSQMQVVKLSTVFPVNNGIPISVSGSQESTQGSLPKILSVASNTPLIVVPKNIAGASQRAFNCTRISIPIQRPEEVQRTTLTLRPQLHLVTPQVRPAAPKGGAGSISVIGNPTVPVKYVIINDNGRKFLTPLTTNVRLNGNIIVNNGSTVIPAPTLVRTSELPISQENQAQSDLQNCVLVKIPQHQSIISTNQIPIQQSTSSTNQLPQQQSTNTNKVLPKEPHLSNVQLSARLQLFPYGNLDGSRSSNPTLNIPRTTAAVTSVRHVAPNAKETAGQSSSMSGHPSIPDTSSGFSKAQQHKPLTTVHVGNNITVYVPEDMAAKRERLQQIINEELVRGILLNDSEVVTVEPSAKSGETESFALGSSSKLKIDEPGYSKLPVSVWKKDHSFDDEVKRCASTCEKSISNSISLADDLPCKATPSSTRTTSIPCGEPSVITEGHVGNPIEIDSCSASSFIVEPEEKIFLKDIDADVESCEEEDLPSDPLALLSVTRGTDVSEKNVAVLCDNANDLEVLPISVSNAEETFVTTFTNLLKQDTPEELDKIESLKQARPYDSPYTSGTSSFRVMSLGDVEVPQESQVHQLEVKVKKDDPSVEDDRVLFSPASILSSSTPPEEDLSLRTVETLADSDSELGPTVSRTSFMSGVEECPETPASDGHFYQHSACCLPHIPSSSPLAMDASESLATSEVLLANLSSEESGSLPPHGPVSSPHRSPKRLRRSSSFSSSADAVAGNSPVDLRNSSIQGKKILPSNTEGISSHAPSEAFTHRSPPGDTMLGSAFSNLDGSFPNPNAESSANTKQSQDLSTPSTSSYLSLDKNKRESRYGQESTVVDYKQVQNNLSKGESSGRELGVLLNLDSYTVLPQNVHSSQWCPMSSSSCENQRQPSLSHQSDIGNVEANTNSSFSSSDILRNISSYLSPTHAGASANGAHFEEKGGMLSSLNTSLNLGAEFALPYDDVGPTLMSPSRSPTKNESPKKPHSSPRVAMSSPQPSTSGLNKRPFPSAGGSSSNEAEYEFDYDSDCYADSECDLGRSSSLSQEQWKCSQCNKMFKSLKEKLLHAGKHSPGCAGSASSWDRTVPDSTEPATSEDGASEGAKSVAKDSIVEVKELPPLERERLKAESVLVGMSTQSGPDEMTISEEFIEADLDLMKLKTLEACKTRDESFRCTECFTEFQRADDLLSHRKTVLNSKSFCPLCHREFRSKVARNSHIKVFHIMREYRCTYCYMVYKSLSSWRRHQLVHLGIVPFECNVCGKRFTRRFDFVRHERVHTGEKPYVCMQCPKTFASESNLRRHLFTHSDNQETKCDTCDKVYKNPGTLTRHKLTAHPVPGQILKSQRDFICSFENCGLVFRSTKKLSWHQETHERWPKRCTFCQDRFIHKSYLVKHIRLKHDPHYQQDEEGNSPCPICSKVFLKSSLPQHMRIHSGVKPYKCHMCNKKFRVKCNLDAHMFVHSGKRDRPHKCNLCVRSFSREKDLEAHVRSHKNIRPFTCNECGKSFIHKNNLTAHIAQHSGRKQHTCMYCAKTFFRKYNLRNHERVHTGETPYSCSICGKTFTQKSNYNVHRKSFHVDRQTVHEEI